MVKRTDLVWILFLCVCMWHVCPASPCGGNPMRSVENFARRNGIESSAEFLDFMRLNTPSDYSFFMQEYRSYLDCTQSVQNGYFKRSADFSIDESQIPPGTFSKEEQVIDKRDRNHIEQNLVSATVDTQPKMVRSSLLRSQFKRKWDELRESGDPKWRKETTIQLEPIRDSKLYSIFKRLLSDSPEDHNMVDADHVYKKSNVYTEINSRRR